MSLAVDKSLLPIAGFPSRPRLQETTEKLNITVVFTSVGATLAALREAGALANHLNAQITLLVPQVVPYPLELEMTPASSEFHENRFRVMASQGPVETKVHICLCRDRIVALKSVLKPGSIVVVGGPKRWWPTKNETLARQLRRAGYEVIFKETE